MFGQPGQVLVSSRRSFSRRLWAATSATILTTSIVAAIWSPSPAAAASVPGLGPGEWLKVTGSLQAVQVCAPQTDTTCVTASTGEGVNPVGGDGLFTCVELAQRLYKHLGWSNGVFPGVPDDASQIFDNYKQIPGMQQKKNNTGYVPVPGDMIVTARGSNREGHVAIVDTVDVPNKVIHVVEQNVPSDNPAGRRTYTWSGSKIKIGPWDGRPILGTVHYKDNKYRNGSTAIPPTPNKIKAAAKSSTLIKVTWSDTSIETGYSITDSLSTITVGKNSTSYTWKVTPGTYKCFAVSAYNAAGTSSWTDWACTATPGPTGSAGCSSIPTASFCGEYYNNQTLSGSATLVRNDPSIDFDWGSGSPASTINADGFSARWQGWFNFAAGSYTFTAQADDGVRVWLDGGLLIDHWIDQGWTTYQVGISLASGAHKVKMEYYEDAGGALARLDWSEAATVPSTPDSITAVPTSPTTIKISWSDTGSETGYHITDSLTTVALSQNATSYIWTVSPGTYKCFIVSAYNAAGSSPWTDWACTTTPGSTYADVVVDDQSGGFVKAGTAANWAESPEGYDNHFWWTHTRTSGVDNRVMWTPSLPVSGNWEVLVYIPSGFGTTTNARYRVDHQGLSTTVSVNQNNFSDAWVSLGTYAFSSDPSSHLFMGDETYEPSTDQSIAFDAVEWVWRGP